MTTTDKPATPTPPAKGADVIALRRADAAALVDRLDSIANALTGIGTANDKGQAGRPSNRTPLTPLELLCLYRFNGYSRRFVDIVPDDATRKGWAVRADDDPDDAMKDEDKRLGVRSKVADAHRWGRLFGGAALLLVTDDAATRTTAPDALAMPLDLESVEAVLNLVVLDGREVQPFRFGGDPRDANFREPETWHVTPGGRMVTTGPAASSIEVHTSRLIYWPGLKLPPSERFTSNSGLDQSILEAPWDHIRNLTTTDQGAAILAQELKVDTLKVEGLAALATADEQMEFFETKIQSMLRSMSMLNMRILGMGDDFTSEAANVSGYKDLSEGARVALSAVTGIPQVILFGDSPGGLNADGASARTIWDRAIAAVQERIYRSRLERLYEVLFAAKAGPSGGVVPDEWSLEFAALDEPDDATEATTRKTTAEMDAIYIGAGVYDPEDVAESRFGERGYQAELQAVAPADTGLGGGSFADLDAMLRAEVDEAAAPATAATPDTPAELDNTTIRRIAEAVVAMLRDTEDTDEADDEEPPGE